MQMKAPALERVGEVALAIGGQDHRRLHHRRDGAELGDADLVIREYFEQKRFEFGVRFVSSTSSTQPLACSRAWSRGRGSTNSLEKNTSPKSCSRSSAADSVSAPPKTSPSLSFRI